MPEHAHDPRTPGTGALRTPPVEEWDSWPFQGGVRPKVLRDPEPEPDRDGEGARPCEACGKADTEYIWTDERWRLQAFPPSGLPFVAMQVTGSVMGHRFRTFGLSPPGQALATGSTVSGTAAPRR